MPKSRSFTIAACTLIAMVSATVDAAAATAILVSVPDQRLVLVRDGERVAEYKISTSRFGLGDKPRSYSTPLGKLQVAGRVGAGLPAGSVFKGRQPTGEVLKPNARGRDPIVTRILHLRGLEPQNDNAYGRAIYIHGTPVERTIGKPDSYGCVRMRSKDIIKLFDATPEGTTVEIVNERVRRTLPKVLIATLPPPPPAVAEGPAGQASDPRLAMGGVKGLAGKPNRATMVRNETRVGSSDSGTRPQKMHFGMNSVGNLPTLGGRGELQNAQREAQHRQARLSMAVW